MERIQRLYRVLLVSASEKFNGVLLPLLTEEGRYAVTPCPSGGAARRKLLEETFDIVLIHAPLPDEFGVKLALDISEQNTTGVMLFVRAEHYPDVNARVSPYGILTISRPTATSFILQSLSLLCATRERLRRMEQKTSSLEEKMEEIRLVNRAKWLLISTLKMSEPDAHRYIEKTAMDRCITKREVAESILKIYQ